MYFIVSANIVIIFNASFNLNLNFFSISNLFKSLPSNSSNFKKFVIELSKIFIIFLERGFEVSYNCPNIIFSV